MSDYRILDLTNPNIQNFPLFNKLAVSSTNTYTTTALNVGDFQTTTFQVEWTGTPTGTISVLGSLDGVNFRSFGASVSNQPAGSASGVLIPLYGSGVKWLQISYVNASSSGTMTITALGKTR